MAIKYLDAEHHIVRYVPWAKLRKDADENVLGVLGAAFKLREGENFLSATWAEYFSGTHEECLVAAVWAIRRSKISVKPRSGFAVGNVARVRDACLSDRRPSRVRFIHEREPDNEAHAALRGWPIDNDDLLELIAEDPWSLVMLNKDIPEA